MKKIFAFCLLLALMTVLLAGCGGAQPSELKKVWKVSQECIGYLRQNVDDFDILQKDDVELLIDLTGSKAKFQVRHFDQSEDSKKQSWEADDTTITIGGVTFEYTIKSEERVNLYFDGDTYNPIELRVY